MQSSKEVPKGSKPKTPLRGVTPHLGPYQVPVVGPDTRPDPAVHSTPHLPRQTTPGPHATKPDTSPRIAGRTIDHLGQPGHPAPHFTRQSTPAPRVSKPPDTSPRIAGRTIDNLGQPGHPAPNFTRRGTSAGTGRATNASKYSGRANDSHKTSTLAGAGNKIAGQDDHAMPFQTPPPRHVHRKETDSDIWVRIKTVESDAPGDEDPVSPVPVTKFHPPNNHPRSSANKTHHTKQSLEYKGRELSITDLLPATFGHGTFGVLEKYSKPGHVVAPDLSSNSAGGSQKLRPVVQYGLMYLPSKTRPGPEHNSFAETIDLGHLNPRKTWTVELGNYRDDEVTFALEGFTLLIEGKQSRRRGQARTTTESVEMPIGYDIDFMRVYRNRQLGTLTIAYVPPHQG